MCVIQDSSFDRHKHIQDMQPNEEAAKCAAKQDKSRQDHSRESEYAHYLHYLQPLVSSEGVVRSLYLFAGTTSLFL